MNKSNGQLCVTIPKNSGINDGDVVSVEKEKVRNIVYSYVTGDLFHYGHLKLLEEANKLGDFHVCGVLTNEAIKSYKEEPVAGLQERKAIISSLRCVDMVMVQHKKDPTDNLKEIHKQFKGAKITLVHALDWKDVPGRKYVEKTGGKVVQPEFYDKLSTKNIIKKILKVHRSKEGK
ncbi:adenylyltransferase/cytidyltransferase family protein [Candidatus Woesearchaeota archaeon]|nr:adenylyltransferase/cytidyltransferase family protein [Candidatus Woesearchaeota archaeon]